jgi:methylated-DNA-protein-cysteine methyltransferase-like protein
MIESVEPGFRERVETLVRQIPKGRVMTYGQLAALCGNARAARIVGGVAHFGDPSLPWQRVVNKRVGSLLATPAVGLVTVRFLNKRASRLSTTASM